MTFSLIEYYLMNKRWDQNISHKRLTRRIKTRTMFISTGYYEHILLPCRIHLKRLVESDIWHVYLFPSGCQVSASISYPRWKGNDWGTLIIQDCIWIWATTKSFCSSYWTTMRHLITLKHSEGRNEIVCNNAQSSPNNKQPRWFTSHDEQACLHSRPQKLL